MSTRATYLFKATDEFLPDVCIYIHHDGYEEGAAFYFYSAWKASTGHRLHPEDMIRGNDKAEITRSHDAHGDTEYRYTLLGNYLEVLHGYGDDFKVVYDGDWVEFVNNNISADWVPDFKPLRRVKYGHSEIVASPESLCALRDADAATLGGWLANGTMTMEAGNAKSLSERIQQASALLGGFGEITWKS